MVTRGEIIRALEATLNAGCSFSASVPAPGGGMHLPLTPADIAACILDGVNLPARLTGLSAEEYAEWLQREGHVVCSASVRSGRTCRNLVSGPPLTDPAEWKAFRDTQPYCRTHGGS